MADPVEIVLTDHNDVHLAVDPSSKLTSRNETHIDPESKLETVSTANSTGLAKLELAIPDPIQTQGFNSIDIKPLQTDTCLTLDSRTGIDPLPPTCLKQPYHHHFGITLFGVETVGVTVSGETQTLIEDTSRPQVAWGGEHAPPRQRHSIHVRPKGDWGGESRSGPGSSAPGGSSGGISIRLGN